MPVKLIVLELNEVPDRVIDAYVAERPDSHWARVLARSARFVAATPDTIQLHPKLSWQTFHRGGAGSRARLRRVQPGGVARGDASSARLGASSTRRAARRRRRLDRLLPGAEGGGCTRCRLPPSRPVRPDLRDRPSRARRVPAIEQPRRAALRAQRATRRLRSRGRRSPAGETAAPRHHGGHLPEHGTSADRRAAATAHASCAVATCRRA